MRKKLLSLFAALSMVVGAGASVAPTEAQAQSYRADRGHSIGRRDDRPRRGYRGYRGRDIRANRGRSYRADRRYRDDRRGRNMRHDRGPGRHRFDNRRHR